MIEKDGSVWVEGHYRNAPDKKSYPRSNLPVPDDEKKRLHKLRNIDQRIKRLLEAKKELEFPE